MGKTNKFLTINDSKDSLNLLNRLIKNNFPEVIVIDELSKEKGLEIAVQEDPDVIIVDFVMSELDGLNVCKRLKEDDRTKEIPVIFLMEHNVDKQYPVLALEYGVEGLISKPIDESEFTSQIRSMINIKNSYMQKRVLRQLLKSNDQLVAMNEAMNRFLTEITHQIVTPMNGVLGFIQLLESTMISSEQQEYIDNIKCSSQKLLKVVDDILDFLKIEPGKISPRKSSAGLDLEIEKDEITLPTNEEENNININIVNSKEKLHGSVVPSDLESVSLGQNLNNNLRILLVEDNDINIKYFVKLLKHIGFSCDVALDGLEALRTFQKKDFDVIFMDCQMPVLNGYETTEMIRQIEGNERHTPIIAMTAYAMIGDKERCINAGMDDYISKPFTSDQIMSILQKYICKISTGVDEDECSYFTDYLQNFIKQSGFEREFCESLIIEFAKLAEKIIAEIKLNINIKNYEECSKLLHKLKGASGSIFALDIAKNAKEAEDAVKNSDMELLNSSICKIEGIMNSLCFDCKKEV